MIDMSGHANWDGERLTRIVATGSGKALVRAAAYLRGVAKRKVKRRKRVSSPEGTPPYAHSGIFKASILFGVDAGKTTAVIGPERLGGTPSSLAMLGIAGGGSTRRNESGQTIPDILEHGGKGAAGVQQVWWNKPTSALGRPRGGDDSAITRFFKHLGFGPAYWAESSATLQARNARRADVRKYRGSLSGGAKKQGWIKRRFSPMKKRRVFLQNIRITTVRQAVKVKDVVLELFGRPIKRGGQIAPRPLMAPTLAENQEKVSAFWRNLT